MTEVNLINLRRLTSLLFAIVDHEEREREKRLLFVISNHKYAFVDISLFLLMTKEREKKMRE